MKLGFVCQGWWPDVGGIESHTRDLARHLIARGHEVAALCLDGTPDLEPFSTRDEQVLGVELRRMAYRYHDHRRLSDLVENEDADRVVAAWLRDACPDVVHVHHLTGFGAGALTAVRAHGAPCVMTLHDYWMLCPRGQMYAFDGEVCEVLEHRRCGECLGKTWPHLFATGPSVATGGDELARDEALARSREDDARERSRIALEALFVPDRLLAPSEATLEIFVRAGVPRDRLELCPYGIEAEHIAERVAVFREMRRVDRENEREIRVGVLGAVIPSKGVLEIAHAVLASRDERLVLDVHGPCTSYHGDTRHLQELEALEREHARIRLHGPYSIEELPAILAGLDALAAPSIWNEVFGLTAREAAAAGLPVLVSDRGGLSELARRADDVVVVRAGDRDAWVRALGALASDLDRSRRSPGAARGGHRNGARARVRTTADMADQLESSYAELLGSNGPVSGT